MTTSQLQALWQTSSLSAGSAEFLDALYEQFLQKPDSIEASWREYFLSLQQANNPPDVAHGPIRNKLFDFSRQNRPHLPTPCLAPDAAKKQAAVLRLINSYRVRGHQQAKTNPLCLQIGDCPGIPDLDLSYHHLSRADGETLFNTGSLVAPDQLPLNQIVTLLKATYCGSIGSEYMYLTETEEKRWLQNRIEGSCGQADLSSTEKQTILQLLTAAEGIERYLHTRYAGQKRFSLEGGESLIPILDEMVQRAGQQGNREIIIGMAHRGRLNVLINLLGKSPAELFREFEGKHAISGYSGDVKYHQGFSTDVATPGGPVHLALAFNPSHLEIINPVVQGSVRARQQRRHDLAGKQVLGILIHGDAAFAGQGVVMESLNMSQTRGYTTGGTVHIIINNQIGFTTSNAFDARSTLYCSDVAKMVQAPIFHVNGDDPEAAIFTTRLALDFCHQFQKDVVIDLICYRRHGHNEADEPAVTQPIMYQLIRQQATTRELYAQRLIQQQVIGAAEAERWVTQYRAELDAGNCVARHILAKTDNPYAVDWRPYFNQDWETPAATQLPLAEIQALTQAMLQLPAGFELHPRVARILEDRRKMAAGALDMDWGFAETLAYASLLMKGYAVRLSGQDSGRGTFFHRHAILLNQKTGEMRVPLQHLDPQQAHFVVINSVLSEEAVLAFEYGYATAAPRSLVIWEAQFGDFANGAQVVIDQFISSGEAKWQRLCGLVMLLPHGYEGQGPEHSSARLERYLQLCAEHNLQVCVPTTPAQMFHLLQRQMLRPYRKPLIILSPKSLLRHPLSVSNLEAITAGQFQPLIDEVDPIDPTAVTRLVMSCGKVYYDLLEKRRALQLTQTALIRLEQLYPFPERRLREILARYPQAQTLVWCQDEPENQGAWYQLQHRLRHLLQPDQTIHYAGREQAASPAVGHYGLHIAQQNRLLAQALAIPLTP